MNYYRNTLVSQAESWLGFNEADGSHKEIIDVYNSRNVLARGYKVKYTDKWCATFVSACSIKCGYTDIIPTECSCGEMIKLFKKIGAWKENDDYIPLPGDIIFYDWDDNGIGDNTSDPDHVGIVKVVISNEIAVIEGNYSNSVKIRYLKVNGKYIRGYGVPAYTGVGEKVTKPKTEYALKAFVKDVQRSFGASVDGIAGPETISKTRTISAKTNSRHAVVKYIQRRLITLGYKEVGSIDGVAGPKFTSAIIHFQKDNKCVADGIISARNKTWKKLLGME